MTALTITALSRPETAGSPGLLGDRLCDLVETPFPRLLAGHPTRATHLGIHAEGERPGDGSRDAALAELVQDKAHRATVEEVRAWERRSTALDELGDALLILFARDVAPLPERLHAIASRLEAMPALTERA
jgi:hypothetical protein